MTEQKGEVRYLIFGSLGPKNRDGLLSDLAERIKQELASGTTQMSIVVGQEVQFGIPSTVEKRKRPGYASLRIKKDSLGYDGFGGIIAKVKGIDGQWRERMIICGEAQADVVKNLIQSQGDEVLIDIAAHRLFEIRDEKTGKVKFGHPEGKKEWFEFLPTPYFGIWVKMKEKDNG